jgi:hypothetical protein
MQSENFQAPSRHGRGDLAARAEARMLIVARGARLQARNFSPACLHGADERAVLIPERSNGLR